VNSAEVCTCGRDWTNTRLSALGFLPCVSPDAFTAFSLTRGHGALVFWQHVGVGDGELILRLLFKFGTFDVECRFLPSCQRLSDEISHSGMHGNGEYDIRTQRGQLNSTSHP
jgi:hypothetical protein